MNLPLIIANVLTLMAFFIHTFVGDRELHLIEPTEEQDNANNKREKWTMARAGWHWISFDLLFATVGLGVINFTNYLNQEEQLLNILALYFWGYAIFWAFTITISKPFPKRYLKLGQWILLALIGSLILVGSNITD